MKKPVTNLPASVRDRLARIARDQGVTFQQALSYYAIERLLYRLAVSEYGASFVLKGGLIFIAHGLPLRRPTRDIDLHSRTPNPVIEIERIFRAVCDQAVEADGMRFDAATVKGEQITPGLGIPGVRLTLRGSLGVAVVPMRVDVTFSNVITPAVAKTTYPSLLGMPTREILTYPFETAVAEKLQAMIQLGSINDRLRDFYDIWLLSTRCAFEGAVLQAAIRATFEHRGTAPSLELPIAFSDEFASLKQAQWRAFMRTFEPDVGEKLVFAEVIAQLRRFAVPLLEATAKGREYRRQWSPETGWR